jgi:hypothetical protein
LDGWDWKEVSLIVDNVVVENEVTVEIKGRTHYFVKLYGPKWPRIDHLLIAIKPKKNISITLLDAFYLVIEAW